MEKTKTWFAPAKYSEEEISCDLSAKRLFNPVQPRRWGAFILSSVALYALLYGIASLWNWQHEPKKLTDHYYQLLYLVLLANFLFFFGNFNNTFSYWFPIGMLVGGLGIAYMGTLPGFSFSTGSLTSLSGTPLFTVMLVAGVLLYMAYRTFKHYQSCGMQNIFYILFFAPLAILAVGYLLAKLDSKSVEVHLHHWQWALLFVFFARYPGIPWQSFLSGFFVGIVIDGIARWGPDPLFEPIVPPAA